MDPRTEKMLAERRPPAVMNGSPGLRLSAYRTAAGRWFRAHRGLALIGVALIVAAFAAGARYLLVVQPAQERDRAALAQQRALQDMTAALDAKQASLEACLATADADHVAVWEAGCRERRQRAGCSLPREVVARQQRVYTDARNDCMRRFSLASDLP